MGISKILIIAIVWAAPTVAAIILKTPGIMVALILSMITTVMIVYYAQDH